MLLFHLSEESVHEISRPCDVFGVLEEPLKASFLIADFVVDLVLHIFDVTLAGLVNLIIFIVIGN